MDPVLKYILWGIGGAAGITACAALGTYLVLPSEEDREAEMDKMNSAYLNALHEIKEVKTHASAEIKSLKDDIGSLKTELKADLTGLTNEVKSLTLVSGQGLQKLVESSQGIQAILLASQKEAQEFRQTLTTLAMQQASSGKAVA